MNKLLFILFIGILFSCESSQTKDKDKETINTQDILSQEPTYVSSKKEGEINPTLLESLNGIWASDEYREELFKSNSVTAAEKAISFYTDIVFDGKEILHCNKPSFMEEHYLYLKADSTVNSYEGEFIFKIIMIENQKMEIKASSNHVYSYKRVIKNTDLDRIYMEVSKGTNAIEKEWISGSYKVMLDTLEFNAELLKNGDITSELKFKWISPYSYLEKDIIEYRFDNDSTLLFTIKEYSDALITLEGIEDITEMDAPIVPNGKIGYMKKN